MIIRALLLFSCCLVYHEVMLIINEIDQLGAFILIIYNILNVLARGLTTLFVFVFVFTVLSVCAFY